MTIVLAMLREGFAVIAADSAVSTYARDGRTGTMRKIASDANVLVAHAGLAPRVGSRASPPLPMALMRLPQGPRDLERVAAGLEGIYAGWATDLARSAEEREPNSGSDENFSLVLATFERGRVRMGELRMGGSPMPFTERRVGELVAFCPSQELYGFFENRRVSLNAVAGADELAEAMRATILAAVPVGGPSVGPPVDAAILDGEDVRFLPAAM